MQQKAGGNKEVCRARTARTSGDGAKQKTAGANWRNGGVGDLAEVTSPGLGSFGAVERAEWQSGFHRLTSSISRERYKVCQLVTIFRLTTIKSCLQKLV
ncbi:MAG: hypothetical protein ACXVZM_00210 [Terriglobales bacterium]